MEVSDYGVSRQSALFAYCRRMNPAGLRGSYIRMRIFIIYGYSAMIHIQHLACRAVAESSQPRTHLFALVTAWGYRAAEYTYLHSPVSLTEIATKAM